MSHTSEMWIVPQLLVLFSGSRDLYNSISVCLTMYISLELSVNA